MLNESNGAWSKNQHKSYIQFLHVFIKKVAYMNFYV